MTQVSITTLNDFFPFFFFNCYDICDFKTYNNPASWHVGSCSLTGGKSL